eukprot:5511612-Prymnesium_polylepis.1
MFFPHRLEVLYCLGARPAPIQAGIRVSIAADFSRHGHSQSFRLQQPQELLRRLSDFVRATAIVGALQIAATAIVMCRPGQPPH